MSTTMYAFMEKPNTPLVWCYGHGYHKYLYSPVGTITKLGTPVLKAAKRGLSMQRVPESYSNR